MLKQKEASNISENVDTYKHMEINELKTAKKLDSPLIDSEEKSPSSSKDTNFPNVNASIEKSVASKKELEPPVDNDSLENSSIINTNLLIESMEKSSISVKDTKPAVVDFVEKSSTSSNDAQFSHPVYKKISAANGRINRMSKDDLVDALKYLCLNSR